MNDLKETLKAYAETYNDPKYFETDPIIFPKRFAELKRRGEADLRDVETAAVIAAHLAWGRRSMIVRDCARAMDEMGWKPYDYVMRGSYRDEPCSMHRTVKWCDFAAICGRLRNLYEGGGTLESLSPDGMRTMVFGQKSDLKAANKKIHMMRRWMVRRDGKVDLGLWLDSSPADLVIPLDVHVHDTAISMGVTERRSSDFSTALEITDFFREIFPGDPCKGDFALFGYGVTHQGKADGGEEC